MIQQEPRRLLLHNKAAVCNIQSYRKGDSYKCLNEYNHPFSGCLTDGYEATTIDQLLGGKPVANLRCGFMDPKSRSWLSLMNERFKRCTYVVFTAAFSYGALPSTDQVEGKQLGVCFVALVDEAVIAQLHGFNGTHFQRWEVVKMDSTLLSPTVARSSHMLRALAPRLFPNARYSLYFDIKVKTPENPLGIIRLLEDSELPAVVVTAKHFDPKRDMFREILAVFGHLAERRLGMVPSCKKMVSDPSQHDAHIKGITGRDFHDVFRQYMFYTKVGYPMHHSGMFDSALLVWDHQNPCTAALACLWHNQIAYYSMRVQLNFNYVASALGLTEQVHFLDKFSYNFNGQNFSLVPHGWPRWGDMELDNDWDLSMQ